MKFFVRSLLILFALYGLVFAVGDAYLAHRGAPLWSGILFVVILIGLQYLLSPWLIEFFLDISYGTLYPVIPEVNTDFLKRLCAERGIKLPRLGIIHSGTPNAFSFGRVRSDARIVITQGLLDVLSPEEVNAVLAHELGHIEHYDFAVMTVASFAPLLLYQIYAFGNRINQTRAIAYGAYLCYWISQYIVLFLNRTREYFADHYAAEVTQHPGDLSSALVKIAYGLVRSEGEYRRVLRSGSNAEKSYQRGERRIAGAIALMGISNVRSGAALALGATNPEQAAAVMRWDLVNPWARVYELSSTHPLTALRIRALNKEQEHTQPNVHYPLPYDQQIRWGWFPIEFLIWAAPLICFIVLLGSEFFERTFTLLHITLPQPVEPVLLIVLGISWMLRVAYRYRGEFGNQQIGRLLEDLDVSQMQPRAVRLRGEIIGRGVPGAFWSPDLVLRDETGIIFLQYRQSIPFARLFFALRKAADYIGRNVEVEGWYRRGLTPYVEMYRLTDGTSTHRAYSRWIQYLLAAVAVLIGYWWIK